MSLISARGGTGLLLPALAAGLAAAPAGAQLSLSNAVSLALGNSPKVSLATDDVAKARALVSQARDVYIPSVSVGAGLGDSFGYSPYPPTLFTFSAQSLVYNSSQFDYIRSARAGLEAALLAQKEARGAVAEDTALTFAALARDDARESALHQEVALAGRLVSIVSDRLDAGRDTAIDLTTSKLTMAQMHVGLLRAEIDTANDRAHMAMLLGRGDRTVTADEAFPATPADLGEPVSPRSGLGPGIQAAFATARAKQEQAWGDARYLYRPQVSLILQYNRYASFTSSFAALQASQGALLSPNEEVFGVQITVPLLDKVHQAHARETAADAAHAFHDAQSLRSVALDGQSKLSHSIALLRASLEVAGLSQQLAQQQLAALLVAVNAPAANGPQMTPKDEQNARIAEREKYLTTVDATYQLRQAEIGLMRQTGELESWVEASGPASGSASRSARPRTVSASGP